MTALRHFEPDEVPDPEPGPPVQDGHPCPTCTQLVKQYPRRLNWGLAYTLVRMLRIEEMGEEIPGVYERGWLHMPGFVRRFHPKPDQGGYAGALLHYWGLIESDGVTREDGSTRSGYWRLTDLGRAFARGTTTVPAVAVTFNSRLVRFEGDPITVRDALGTRFDYEALRWGQG